jgi:hypothetical protein
MNTGPATVVVRRSGFLPALTYGVFGTVIALIVCGGVITFSVIELVDRQIDNVMAMSTEVVKVLPDWQKALPPALADAINDRRDLGYRDQLDISARVAGERWASAVVTVKNNGDRPVTLLSLRVVVEDEDGVPVREFTTYAATPIAIEDEWRGPLLPGSTRRFTAGTLRDSIGEWKATVEITELRVWGDAKQPTEMTIETEPMDSANHSAADQSPVVPHAIPSPAVPEAAEPDPVD